MVKPVIGRAFSKVRNDGFREFFESIPKFFLRRRVAQRHLAYADDQITNLATNVLHIEPSEALDISYSGIHVAPYPDFIELGNRSAKSYPRILCEFTDATIRGSRPIFKSSNKFVVPSCIGDGNEHRNPSMARKTFYRNTTIEDFFTGRHGIGKQPTTIDHGFLLTGRFNDFGHWQLEILPKLKSYERYVDRTGEIPRIITRPIASNWQRAILDLLGYPIDNLVFKDHNPIAVDRLIVPSHRSLSSTHPAAYPSPSDIEYVSTRLLEAIPNTESRYGERIYVTRDSAPRRKVSNEAEMVSLLHDYGFERYDPGQYSIPHQISVFSDASVIVGPYGAGLTNMIYATDSTVVELNVDVERNFHHFVLANLSGHRYEYVVGEPTVCDGDVDIRNRDFHVNPTKVEATLDQIL